MKTYPEIPTDTFIQDITELYDGQSSNVGEIHGGSGAAGDTTENLPDEGAEQDQHIPIETQFLVVPCVHQNLVRVGYHGLEGRFYHDSMEFLRSIHIHVEFLLLLPEREMYGETD